PTCADRHPLETEKIEQQAARPLSLKAGWTENHCRTVFLGFDAGLDGRSELVETDRTSRQEAVHHTEIGEPLDVGSRTRIETELREVGNARLTRSDVAIGCLDSVVCRECRRHGVVFAR